MRVVSELGLNRAYLIGRVGSLDLHAGLNGATLLRFEVCTPFARKVDTDTGPEWIETIERHRVLATGTDATWIHGKVATGDDIAIECSLRPSRWTDAAGVAHYETAIVLDRVIFARSRRDVTVPA